MKYYVREWISGARTACKSWDEAYEQRDRLQAESLAAGYDLKRKRFGIAMEL